MKIIKIFLASSEELRDERKELADLVEHLNFTLNKQDLCIQLVKWEYLDSSMGPLHKQEEYNKELRDCELCMVLYWTRFGMYTKTELDTAYRELCAGNNPKKLYVYFKDGEEISSELKEFRDGFPEKYGHFFCHFQNVDTLKADFLLQFMEYLNVYLKDRNVIEIKDSQVSINGKVYVNLQNVPFAGNNEEHNLLLKSIKKTKKLLSVTEENDPEYAEYVAELKELEEKQAQMESSLWDTALMVTQLSNTKCSERLQRAVDLFKSGDASGANAVLKEIDIEKDAQHNLNLIKLGNEGKKGLQVNIDELKLKINVLHGPSKYVQMEEILSKIVEYQTVIYGKYSKEVLGSLLESVWRLPDHPEKVIPFFEEAVRVASELYGEDDECLIGASDQKEYSGFNVSGQSGYYETLSRLYVKVGDIEKAVDVQMHLSELLLKKYGELAPSYRTSLLRIASLKESQSMEDAIEFYMKAINISKRIGIPEDVVDSYDPLIRLMFRTKENDSAEKYIDDVLNFVGDKYEKLPALLFHIAGLGVPYTPRVEKYYKRAIALAETQGNVEIQINAYDRLGSLYIWMQNPEGAEECYSKIKTLSSGEKNYNYKVMLARAYKYQKVQEYDRSIEESCLDIPKNA